jgi:hypothetical protein
VIITNKHVVKESIKGRFVLSLRDANGNLAAGSTKRIELNGFEQRWTPHPDQSVDLCAMPIAELLIEAESQGLKFFFANLDKSLIPSASEIDEMIGLESIVMVGYPNGLWDEHNNLPIFRSGVLATDYKRDWNGRKEFLIDAACFPGSSGSPIMLFDIGSYQSREGFKIGASRIKLLGILYAGPRHTVEGEVQIVYVPTQQRAITVAGIPNNLGIAIKSAQLSAFEGIFS